MKYVIIGNSAAGIGAVEGIRQVDRDSEITVVTSEPHHTYSRPLISYLLLGKTTLEKMRYRAEGFYKANNVAMLHATVTEIDAKNKQVAVSGGKWISYDKLLVATGSSAFVPPFQGLDTVKDKTTFMSLSDAEALASMLGIPLDDKSETVKNDKRVLIIGAGLIGLKCAEGIVKNTAKITVIDLAPRVLSSILDEDGAAMIRKHLESKGVEFKLGSSVKQFDGNTASLDNGETVAFDALVLAVGVRPNTALLNGIAKIERGIVVNARSETSAPDIYAAGDCTQTIDAASGQEKIMALLPNAYMQGECAGVNMAGGDMSFDKAIPMNAIGFFGLHVITAGNYVGDVYTDTSNGNYKKLFYGDNKLNGFILIGDVEKAGIYTSLIRERTPLDSIDFALVCEKPGLMAFTKEERSIKLGGNI